MEDDEFAGLLRSLHGEFRAQDSWAEVATEARHLGETLVALTRAAWQEPENQASLRALQEAVRSASAEIDRAFADTPEAQRARERLRRLRDEVRASAERAAEELRPELLALVREANIRLRRLGGLPE